MRLNRAILIILTLTVFALATTSPATAGVIGCKKVLATLDTLVVEDSVEVGQIEGTIDGAAYLRYDDAAPPIDPRAVPPNFVITSTLGAINLWVYSATELTADGWWRDFEILRSEGTGAYARQRITLEIYGKCSAKDGHYEIEGMICPPIVPPRK
jgi:hypothetical protein